MQYFFCGCPYEKKNLKEGVQQFFGIKPFGMLLPNINKTPCLAKTICMSKNPDKQNCEFLRPAAAMLLQTAERRDEMAHFIVASWYLY